MYYNSMKFGQTSSSVPQKGASTRDLLSSVRWPDLQSHHELKPLEGCEYAYGLKKQRHMY